MTNGNWVQDPDNPEFWYWVTGGGGSGSGNPVTISETAPEDAGEGDLWFCTLESELGLYCYDGTTWFEVGGSNSSGGGPSPSGDSSGVVISPTEPTDKFEGMLWLNSDTAEVFIFDGAVWLEFPAGSSGSGGGLWEANGDDIYYDKANVGIGVTPGSTTGLSLNRDHNLSWQESSGTSLCNAFRQTQTGAFVLTQGYKWSPTAGGFASSQGGEFSRSAVKLGGTIEFYTDPSVDVPEGTDFTPTPRMTIAADGGVNIGRSASVEQYNQLQVTAGIAGIVIKGDGTGSYAQQSFRTDEGSWAVGMRPETGSSFVVRNSASGLIPMTIDADGGVTLAHPAKIWGRRTSNDRAIQLIGYDEGTDDVSLVATNDWYVRNGSFDATLKVSATGRVDIPGTLYVNGVPKIGHSELITTLATLRNATKDETTLEGLRDSIGNAIGGLIEKFEQEIAAGTMEISE